MNDTDKIIHAIAELVESLGMLAENQNRACWGEAAAYDEDSFVAAARNIRKITEPEARY